MLTRSDYDVIQAAKIVVADILATLGEDAPQEMIEQEIKGRLGVIAKEKFTLAERVLVMFSNAIHAGAGKETVDAFRQGGMADVEMAEEPNSYFAPIAPSDEDAMDLLAVKHTIRLIEDDGGTVLWTDIGVLLQAEYEVAHGWKEEMIVKQALMLYETGDLSHMLSHALYPDGQGPDFGEYWVLPRADSDAAGKLPAEPGETLCRADAEEAAVYLGEMGRPDDADAGIGDCLKDGYRLGNGGTIEAEVTVASAKDLLGAIFRPMLPIMAGVLKDVAAKATQSVVGVLPAEPGAAKGSNAGVLPAEPEFKLNGVLKSAGQHALKAFATTAINQAPGVIIAKLAERHIRNHATPEAAKDSLVRKGIYTADGRLAPEYGGKE